MIKLILALGLMAAAPTLAAAQPYDNDQGRYERDRDCDDQGRCADRATPEARDYGRDSDYAARESDRDNRHSDADQYTGRVGAHWTDAYGRRCAWREVTFRDNDDYQAFKWVTVCRD